ncbi:MAG: hypothetical protein A4E63_01401 [Syntrophorhabdus sp. PtaU1.Bin050]|nr:MAG: hypothetical protein A4E63_01401 [Syntrophorhabdus sp. PtaU1.Bin050]
MGLGAADILDERYLFEDVFGLVLFVEAAADDRKGYGIAVFKQEQGGHVEEPVDGPGNPGKLGSGVLAAPEFDGEKEIGLDGSAIEDPLAVKDECALPVRPDFRVGKLEEKIHGLPLGNKGLVGLECTIPGKSSDKGFRVIRA